MRFYPTLPIKPRWDTMSNFKRSKPGVISKFFLLDSPAVHESSYIYIYIYIYIHTHTHTHMTRELLYPVGWDCRIHRLLLCRGGKTPSPNESPAYETKQSDGEVPVTLELWGMRSTPSLPSLPGPLWPGVVWYGPIHGLNRTKLHTYAVLNCLKWVWH